jgi:hypothetical protein
MEPIRFDLGGEDLGGGDDFDTANYSLPFAADDYLIAVERVDGTLGMNLVKGNAQAQAREYGLLQNAIRLGHKNGVNITTEVGNLPSKPLAPLFVNAAGISSGFRLNGTTWAFGPTGMVVSTDLLLCGTAGRLAGAEPIPWLPLPVDPDGLPELAPPTVGTSPAPANTIALPGGFNPASPGGTISSLPTGGSDVFALSQSIGHLVVPYLLRESEAVIVRTIARDVEVPYALTLASEGVEAPMAIAVNAESGDFIPEPEALFSFAVIDEDDDALIGFAVIEEAGEP